MSSPEPVPASAEVQVQFVRHNFDNHQALIRLADTKAAAFITLLIFLAASTLPLAKDAIPKLRWVWCRGGLTSGIYLGSYVVFLCAFLWVILLAYKVVQPRGARHYQPAQPGRDLLYFEHVLLHPMPADYLNAVTAATSELILRNLTDQVFELAHICREKMAALTKARLPIFIAFISWLMNVALGLYVLRWK